LKLNGTHGFLVYANNVNILGGNIHIMKKITEALLVTVKGIGLDVTADKKSKIMSRDQYAGRSHNIKTGNKSFERVQELKFLGTPLTNKNSIYEEIKGNSKTGNPCYYSVQNLRFSSLLSKDIHNYNFACCFVWV
jgi:hypothetical protein